MTTVDEDKGQAWLKKLLQLGGFNAEIRLGTSQSAVDTESRWLTIDHTGFTPQQIDILIGRDGGVIDALQYLANTTLNIGKTSEDQQAYTIELGGYRVRRHQELCAIADRAAATARETQQEQAIKYLSAAERRLIHTYLKQFPDLETVSQGQEPHRFLMVRLHPDT